MARAKEKPPVADRADYEVDFHRWSFAQADLLRSGRLTDLDVPNLVEELESMGNEQLHALESDYDVLIMHLLKWTFQPERRSVSWQVTINTQRSAVRRRERKNPSLAARAGEIVAEIYPDAVKNAALETRLPRTAFPADCPWTLDQLRDDDFLPE